MPKTQSHKTVRHAVAPRTKGKRDSLSSSAPACVSSDLTSNCAFATTETTVEATTAWKYPPFVFQPPRPSSKEEKAAALQKKIEALEAAGHSVSKSHRRRMKRKEKSALVANLAPLEDLLTEVKETEIEPVQREKDLETVPALLREKTVSAKKKKPNRGKLLAEEKMRMATLMKIPQYKDNPYQAIQDHIRASLQSGTNRSDKDSDKMEV